MAHITNAEKFGIEKGIEIGLRGDRLAAFVEDFVEGYLEAKLEAAERLLAQGCKPAFIKKVTDLPLAQIKALQQKLKNSKW